MKRFITLFILLLLVIRIDAAEMVGVLSSFSGMVERKPAGSLSRLIAVKEDTLRENDILSTGTKSKAVLIINDSTRVYCGEQTEFQVNFGQKQGEKTITFNLFRGTLFCVSPEEKSVITLYSPNASASGKECSFSLKFSKTQNMTSLQVVNGTVKVVGLKRNVATYLGAPYQTRITDTTRVISPIPILEEDLTALHDWVPEETVSQELAVHMSRARRDRRVMSGEADNLMVIVPFKNATDYQGPWAISDKIAEILSAVLGKNRQGIETMVAGTAQSDPFEVAAEQKARLILSGTVKKFAIMQFGVLSASADEYREFSSARVRLQIHILESERGDTLYTNTFSGEVNGDNTESNTWNVIGKLPFDLNNAVFAGSILGQALLQMVEQASGVVAHFLKE